jgi:hypothetical protein
MELAKQFEEYVNECMEWAKTARTDREHVTFLEMAHTWMQGRSPRQRARRALPANIWSNSIDARQNRDRIGRLSRRQANVDRPALDERLF